MSFSNIHFILYKPQLPENIGACARALKNYNFKNLSVVLPKVSFPSKKALATSVGAKNIIQSCKIYNNFEKSIRTLIVSLPQQQELEKKIINIFLLKTLKTLIIKKRLLLYSGRKLQVYLIMN